MARLVYNSNNYGLLYLQLLITYNYTELGFKPTCNWVALVPQCQSNHVELAIPRPRRFKPPSIFFHLHDI